MHHIAKQICNGKEYCCIISRVTILVCDTFLQYLSQATILAHDILVCTYTVTSHDTFTICASVLGHVADSRYLYLSVLILVASLVSSVLVLVTGHDTCILSHLLSLHHHHHHSRPSCLPSRILRTVKAWVSL